MEFTNVNMTPFFQIECVHGIVVAYGLKQHSEAKSSVPKQDPRRGRHHDWPPPAQQVAEMSHHSDEVGSIVLNTLRQKMNISSRTLRVSSDAIFELSAYHTQYVSGFSQCLPELKVNLYPSLYP